MKTNHLWIALVLFGMLLPVVGCSSANGSVPVVPAGARAGELVGLKDCEFQPSGKETKYRVLAC